MNIQIDIDDERLFSDVAPVVDRVNFAKEIERIRSVIGINEPILREKPSRLIEQFGVDKINQLDKEIEKSRKSLYLSVVFRKIIEAAVVYGLILTEDYQPAYLCSTLDCFDDQGQTPDETYFIVLSPGVRDQDVLNAVTEYRRQLGNKTVGEKYNYIHQVWETDKKKPSIRKYREWYLALNIKGKSFAEIAEDETKNCPIEEIHTTGKKKPRNCTCYDESTIRKGVATYESLVWKTPTF